MALSLSAPEINGAKVAQRASPGHSFSILNKVSEQREKWYVTICLNCDTL